MYPFSSSPRSCIRWYLPKLWIYGIHPIYYFRWWISSRLSLIEQLSSGTQLLGWRCGIIGIDFLFTSKKYSLIKCKSCFKQLSTCTCASKWMWIIAAQWNGHKNGSKNCKLSIRSRMHTMPVCRRIGRGCRVVGLCVLAQWVGRNNLKLNDFTTAL